MNNSKHWWTSTTVWLNTLAIIAEIVQQVQPYLSADWNAKAILALSVLNIIIRVFKTSAPLRLTSEPKFDQE